MWSNASSASIWKILFTEREFFCKMNCVGRGLLPVCRRVVLLSFLLFSSLLKIVFLFARDNQFSWISWTGRFGESSRVGGAPLFCYACVGHDCRERCSVADLSSAGTGIEKSICVFSYRNLFCHDDHCSKRRLVSLRHVAFAGGVLNYPDYLSHVCAIDVRRDEKMRKNAFQMLGLGFLMWPYHKGHIGRTEAYNYFM